MTHGPMPPTAELYVAHCQACAPCTSVQYATLRKAHEEAPTNAAISVQYHRVRERARVLKVAT